MPLKTSNTALEKGNIGEGCLTTWFRENDIPFFPIKQSPETFAHFFARTGKRPDFFVLIPSLGTIAVDAKNCALSNGYFTIGKKEILDALSFEMSTRTAFWFAFLHIQTTMATWYWISTLKGIQAGATRINRFTGEEFLAISLSDFVPMRTRQDFGQLFADRLHSPPRLTLVVD